MTGRSADEPKLTILNVGHGLCAVLTDGVGTMLFDVAPGAAPRDYLRTIGVVDLDAVMVSHFHKDHCSGITGFLGEDYGISEVFMNRPRADETDTYKEIKAALNVSRNRRKGLPRIRPFDTDVNSPILDRGLVRVRIITPDAVEARSDQTMHEPHVKHTDHSVCGVVRIDYNGHPRVLLTGDLDRRGLTTVLKQDPGSLKADVLVYPHHGGNRTESDEQEFASLLTSHVEPKLVVFSMGRKSGARPHPEVLEGVSMASTAPGVVCTQLSSRCDEREPNHGGRLEPLPILHSEPPEKRRLCCGGSIMIPLQECEKPDFVGDAEHAAFVAGIDVPEPMCQV